MKPAANSVVHRNNELLEKAQTYVYKVIEGGPDLHAHVFYPGGQVKGEDRTAMLFFFSSGWDQGQVSQFAPQCLYFAGRGAVTMAMEYRTKSTHDTTPLQAMADARTAIRWARWNKDYLGVDEFKIVTVGAAAGAHMAAAAAMIADFPDDEKDVQLSCAPDGLALFSPILDTSKKGFGGDRFPDEKSAKEANLLRHIGKSHPPMILLHGTEDRLIPFESVEKFAKLMKRKKNRCELIPFEGKGHGFFNFNVDVVSYEATVGLVDQFLVNHGFLLADEDDDGSSRLISWRQQEY